MSSSSKLVMLTCYDASFARLIALSEAVDFVLVGDSMGTVVYGHPHTLQVTLHQMKEHVEAVRRGLDRANVSRGPLLIADLPVNTYRTDEEALDSGRVLMAAGAEILKVEGAVYSVVKAFKKEGFRVCGHVGLTPQSIQDYRLQGKAPDEAERILKESLGLEEAGCEMIVLEMLPLELAKDISDRLKIPTIGIGAGPETDGQVLVLYDLLGFDKTFSPKFLKRYGDGENFVQSALQSYSSEVRSGQYPDESHSFRTK